VGLCWRRRPLPPPSPGIWAPPRSPERLWLPTDDDDGSLFHHVSRTSCCQVPLLFYFVPLGSWSPIYLCFLSTEIERCFVVLAFLISRAGRIRDLIDNSLALSRIWLLLAEGIKIFCSICFWCLFVCDRGVMAIRRPFPPSISCIIYLCWFKFFLVSYISMYISNTWWRRRRRRWELGKTQYQIVYWLVRDYGNSWGAEVRKEDTKLPNTWIWLFSLYLSTSS